MGQDKRLMMVNGKHLYEYALLAARGARYDNVCVVSSHEEILQTARSYNFQAIKNEIDNCGKSSSIELGLRCLKTMDTVFFLPCDQPLLTSETLNNLIMTAKQHIGHIVIPIYGDNTGSPIGFPSSLYEDLFALSGDQGGKSIIKSNTKMIKYVHIVDEKQGLDVDYAGDIENILHIFQNISK